MYMVFTNMLSFQLSLAVLSSALLPHPLPVSTSPFLPPSPLSPPGNIEGEGERKPI